MNDPSLSVAALRAALDRVALHLDATDPDEPDHAPLDDLHRTLTDALIDSADEDDDALARRLARVTADLADRWDSAIAPPAGWPGAVVDTARAVRSVLKFFAIASPLDFLIPDG